MLGPLFTHVFCIPGQLVLFVSQWIVESALLECVWAPWKAMSCLVVLVTALVFILMLLFMSKYIQNTTPHVLVSTLKTVTITRYQLSDDSKNSFRCVVISFEEMCEIRCLWKWQTNCCGVELLVTLYNVYKGSSTYKTCFTCGRAIIIISWNYPDSFFFRWIYWTLRRPVVASTNSFSTADAPRGAWMRYRVLEILPFVRL